MNETQIIYYIDILSDGYYDFAIRDTKLVTILCDSNDEKFHFKNNFKASIRSELYSCLGDIIAKHKNNLKLALHCFLVGDKFDFTIGKDCVFKICDFFWELYVNDCATNYFDVDSLEYAKSKFSFHFSKMVVNRVASNIAKDMHKNYAEELVSHISNDLYKTPRGNKNNE